MNRGRLVRGQHLPVRTAQQPPAVVAGEQDPIVSQGHEAASLLLDLIDGAAPPEESIVIPVSGVVE
ncbi:MAG: hypothetical protein ACLFVU_11660, partial [Phycisphaerae bacterium]